MNTIKDFDKIYCLDTNIILNNANNIISISDNNKNLVILPETVLDEIDSKKSGLDEISFQARSFARMLQDAEIIDKFELISDNNKLTVIVTSVENSTIYMVSKDEYKSDSNKIANSIRNDRKILEIAEDLHRLEEYKNIKFISLDIMARTRALSIGIDTEALNLGKVEIDSDKEFHVTMEILDYEGFIEDIPEQENYTSSIEIINEKGKRFIYFKSLKGWSQIQDTNHYRLPVPPINKRQKIMSEIIMDKADVTVIVGKAGTGKTLVALGCAMKLIDLEKEKYKKIYYIRRTVISGNKEDELGFLPGTLDEKMQGYNQPMEDSLKKVAQLKKRNATKEVIQDMVYDLKEKYDVEYLYAGHLRGSTLEEGSILICDETQNFDIASIRTIFSRVGKNSHIIAMGSNQQIDSNYLTRNTNALTFLMDKCGEKNTADVRVEGIRLTNVHRSKIAEWADEELYK